jgi:hypothetical protein
MNQVWRSKDLFPTHINMTKNFWNHYRIKDHWNLPRASLPNKPLKSASGVLLNHGEGAVVVNSVGKISQEPNRFRRGNRRIILSRSGQHFGRVERYDHRMEGEQEMTGHRAPLFFPKHDPQRRMHASATISPSSLVPYLGKKERPSPAPTSLTPP